MVDVAVELRVQVRPQDGVEDAELGDFFGLEILRGVEHLAVAVAENVCGVPAAQAEATHPQARSQDGLHQRLTGLEILPADRYSAFDGQFDHAGQVDGEVWRTVGKRNSRNHRRVGVELAW